MAEAVMTLPGLAFDQANFPQMYERWLARPLFRPWAETALAEVGLAPGDRVLDIACGTGILARVAWEQLGGDGRVVGIDVSPGMLAVARAQAPEIDWREGNAGDLPLAEGEQFDIVACQQGLQFFPDKPAAAREMRRATARGGRLAVATWRPDEEVPFYLELRRIAERYLGPISDPRYGFGDATRLETLFEHAGFKDITSRILSLTLRFEEGTPFVRLNTMALIGMSAAGKAMSEDERSRVMEAIVSESVPVEQSYSDGTTLAFEVRTNLLTATG
ncbi:class I SAM-dependent methyltransferase [Devosia nitrariae]|uniref:Ubiquinone/menaquinone biosynthesis methyltransferase n=1 Tax=Devosia nitrariae TaxID=2071872 RepID=A0ABQ5WCL1_9HYPH|nr:methyltransferase domain-containing protein [Devosia nitrariae]GLQ57250.1 ubiquinone/menaquinone biosynthesis methyltransferase [Devosia nitrariae]